MKYLRLLLLPFSWLYGLVVIIRNAFYDAGIYSSRSFDIPVISVGNLDVGGAGKSPMTEYLIRLLRPNFKLATLSRGYGRKTQGYLVADVDAKAALVGDEPAQFKHKFRDITVAVCEKRVIGIEKLSYAHQVIILDDAYQHRAVKPGLSILLFDYGRINEPRLMLPAGNLREPFSGRKRADVVVVSKCPLDMDAQQMQAVKQRLKLKVNQAVFFTGISYAPLCDMEGNPSPISIDADTVVFLLTGIANPKPLLKELNSRAKTLNHHNYPDHHQFTLKNIAKLADEFNACTAQKKLVLTTEKDAERLREQALFAEAQKMNIMVLPITISFLNGQQQFDKLVTDYVRKY